MKLLSAVAFVLGSALSVFTAFGQNAATTGNFDLSQIKHVVVIYQENWSFDGLYANYPGVNGFKFGDPVAQVDISGKPFPFLPQAYGNVYVNPATFDDHFPKQQAVRFYDLEPITKATNETGDIVHKYYTEQQQIDGDKMDGYVAWTNNPGLVLGGYDATTLPEGEIAQDYVMCDNYYHSAFGGSFLNHQFLVAAAAPVWPNALTPASASAMLASAGAPAFVTPALVENGSGSNLLPLPKVSRPASSLSYPENNNWPKPLGSGVKPFDNDLTMLPTTDGGKDYYAVNTVQPSSWPFSLKGPFLPLLTNRTIGDLLDEGNVTWKWYSGGWDQAMGGNPDPEFQYHHQPFNYYEKYAPGTPGRAHLVDQNQFAVDLVNNNLPQVCFVKFLGEFNEHPGYSELAASQQATADFVNLILHSDAKDYAPNGSSTYVRDDTLIIITYDENGGRWDHVPPPKLDNWGPGTRVPLILISKFLKRPSATVAPIVDHHPYDTTSILSFIEERWHLGHLNGRDANAPSLSSAFNLPAFKSAQ